MVEAPLKVQCYASPERTEVLSRPADDDTVAPTVHARVGGVRPVALERDAEKLQKWSDLATSKNLFVCGRV